MSQKHFSFIKNYSDFYNEFTNNIPRYANANELSRVSSNAYLICEDRIIRYAQKMDPEYPLSAVLECISDNWFEP